MKHLQRYQVSKDGFSTEPSNSGLLFCHPTLGKVLDLTDAGFRIVGACVDTYRQIFKGRMNEDFLSDVNLSIDLGEKQFRFFGYDWLVGKSSKSSGYQYRLQNNELDLILLFKMFHAKADSENSHLKIECSPWFLYARSPDEVDDLLIMLAKRILMACEAHYPAVHLAVDMQGWEPEKDLSENIVCRCRRVSQYNGIDSAEFYFSEISCVYDRSQSFKFGPANSVQLAIYDKTVQSRAIDKLDYMEQKWRNAEQSSDCRYDPEKGVFRVEIRFHHSVVQQFALGSYRADSGEIGLSLKSYAELVQHLHGLWQYGLQSFKLKYNKSYFHPIWSILICDVDFELSSSISDSLKPLVPIKFSEIVL